MLLNNCTNSLKLHYAQNQTGKREKGDSKNINQKKRICKTDFNINQKEIKKREREEEKEKDQLASLGRLEIQ